jgi:predicted DNA-binding transcriptional regulator YafY
MPLTTRISRLARIDRLARLRAPGTPEELAARLGIGLATLYRDLDLMRELGAPLAYCNRQGSYYYTVPGQLQIGFYPPEMRGGA